MKTTKNLYGMLLVFLVITLIIAALSLAVMLLWNWIMPALLLSLRISFLQAVGLTVLSSLLSMDKAKLFSWIYE